MRASGNDSPLVWILAGPKAGDNAQLRTLASALNQLGDWTIAEKPLAFRRYELLLHIASRPTLAGLDRRSRTGLRPPWPDLVLTAGRRNELVARWIKNRSGNRTRLVHVGRPWSRPERFDLVVSTPQYALQPSANVLINPLPLQQPDPARLSDAAGHWAARLEHLPTPRIALLLGGDSGPFVFTSAAADRLARQLNTFVGSLNGSLLLTTSPRTPDDFSRRLEEAIDVPSFRYRWTKDAAENPYWALLALADRIVVTEESVSMITEALATGKPTYLASISPAADRPWWLHRASYRWKPLTHRLAMVLAPARFSRDVGRIHAELVEDGRAAWLGEGHPSTRHVEDGSLNATITRVLALMSESAGKRDNEPRRD